MKPATEEKTETETKVPETVADETEQKMSEKTTVTEQETAEKASVTETSEQKRQRKRLRQKRKNRKKKKEGIFPETEEKETRGRI